MKSNLFFQFEKILSQINRIDYPSNKKESILREFLQVKILEKIYQQKNSRFLYFVGGTSLRILRGLDRFSEDLDFDFFNLSFKDIENIYDNVVLSFKRENIKVIEYKNLDKKPIEFELRFPEILYELGLSNYKDQNLVIKLDFDNYWQGLIKEIILLDRFDVNEKIITINKDQLLVLKIFAYLNRKQTLARDMYDIVWLIKNEAKIDWNFLKINKINNDMKNRVFEKFKKEKNKINLLKKNLEPLLINNNSVNQLDYFQYYFLPEKNLVFKKFLIEEIGDQIILNFVFEFKDKDFIKEIKFKFIISETARAKIDFLPKNEDDKKKIDFVVEKLYEFYKRNIIKNYQTKLISTINLANFNLNNLEEVLS